MRIIGDVHGYVEEYLNIISTCKKSIQVGDVGFKHAYDKIIPFIENTDHKICFGNHDYYPYLNKSFSCGNFSFIDNIFTIRGAVSYDRYRRIEGVDYFLNEEMTYLEMSECFSLYEQVKPDIVVSHESPSIFKKEFYFTKDSSTANFMDQLFKLHKPKMWIFGHLHESIIRTIEGCEFNCLNELEYIDI